MKVLVVGSGGREHALCWSFARSPLCEGLYCAPGNPGIAKFAECVPLQADAIDELVTFAQTHEIDFVMVGPEVPLTMGLVDRLTEKGISAFGPTQAAAALEGSKGFMKDLCKKAGIPTAAYERFKDAEAAKTYVRAQGAPIVVKADGLAAGKGVTIAQTVEEACAAIDDAMLNNAFGAAGAELVIEEFMVGEEASFFALSDGDTAIPFTTAQDHKAVYDGDKGPNTGGMGAFSPAVNVDENLSKRVMDEIILPTVKAMKEAGTPFIGMMYAGLMLTKDGPKLVEYNARFGDPETQVMLPRMKSDLLAVLFAVTRGFYDNFTINWHPFKALTVVMAANGYPASYEKGTVIKGTDEAEAIGDVLVFHAGTKLNDAGELTANGGRVLNVTAVDLTFTDAQARAYAAVEKIDWAGGFCRHDIGWRAVKRESEAR